jgi:hypothetical protein
MDTAFSAMPDGCQISVAIPQEGVSRLKVPHPKPGERGSYIIIGMDNLSLGKKRDRERN